MHKTAQIAATAMLEKTMVTTEPLVNMEQTETMMLTEQMEKMGYMALTERTKNIDATETLNEDGSDADNGALMVKTTVMTE